MQHDFEIADYGIKTIGSSSELNCIKSAIRKYWMGPTREDITSIREAEEFEGCVFAIEMRNMSPPTLGSYLKGLLFEGWGIIHYDSNTLYIGKIKYDTKEDTFYFKGRKNMSSNNELSFLDKDITIKDTEDTELYNIVDTITNLWNKSCLDVVSEIKGSSNKDMYIIETNTNTSYIDENNKRHQINPSIPTGKPIDSLLSSGWVVSAVKYNMIFISRIRHVISNDIKFSIEQIDNVDELSYCPRECEVCGEHEFQNTYITGAEDPDIIEGKLPVYTSVCYSCYRESPENYMNRSEFKDKYSGSEI